MEGDKNNSNNNNDTDDDNEKYQSSSGCFQLLSAAASPLTPPDKGDASAREIISRLIPHCNREMKQEEQQDAIEEECGNFHDSDLAARSFFGGGGRGEKPRCKEKKREGAGLIHQEIDVSSMMGAFFPLA